MAPVRAATSVALLILAGSALAQSAPGGTQSDTSARDASDSETGLELVVLRILASVLSEDMLARLSGMSRPGVREEVFEKKELLSHA